MHELHQCTLATQGHQRPQPESCQVPRGGGIIERAAGIRETKQLPHQKQQQPQQEQQQQQQQQQPS